MFSSTQPVSTKPWPRYIVDAATWNKCADAFAAGTHSLFGLWADSRLDNPAAGAEIHMAIYENATHKLAVATLPVPDGVFPSVARRHAPAARLERTIMDMHGLRAEGAVDTRAWLDHGKWRQTQPLAAQPAPHGDVATAVADYVFLPVEGEGLHEVPVGPIHAGIIEPGHFRFSANGEAVVRLEEKLGYLHKGIEKLFIGADIARGAKLAGRISGDSTVAYAFAYAQAVEQATGTVVPPRALYLRALMAELERIANHFGDVGGICNDAAFAFMLAHTGILREETLQLCHALFGHRLMMDVIVPGGVTADIGATGVNKVRAWMAAAEKRFDKLMRIYDDAASLKDRTNNTGYVSRKLVDRFGAGGYVGRASGRAFDARKNLPYAPYDTLNFDMPVLHTGDVNARLWIRRIEIAQSFAMIAQLLDAMPAGALCAPVTAKAAGEGIGVVEAFRGDVLVWLRLGADGNIARCHPRDASWFQWPLLEASIENNIIADFPLCNKSFNCSYAGHDL